ncbi:MAG TPA: DinB family protein [Bryobacteraceae bacterium]|nr:DinB family protein [Bryobacteraceae bacterium]
MYTKDAIRFSLNMAEQAVLRSLADIEDIPLTFPTEKGGCHPLWVVGHLALVEGLTHQMLAGGENPAADWAGLFAPETIPTGEAAKYPSIEKVRATYLQLRRRNLQFLDSLSEIELDKPVARPPKGLEEHFATYGKALLTLALHQMAHRGQITDAIRAAGRAAPVAVGTEA